MTVRTRNLALSALVLSGMALLGPAQPARADGSAYIAHMRQHKTLASTIPANGDMNPYAMVVAPASFGVVRQGDVLVDNFNNNANLQGTGTTIVGYRPGSTETYTFATLPRDLPGCPGGVGLTTAMAVLKSGWVIVGSAPSEDGSSNTMGPGCLIVVNSAGKVAGTFAGPEIADPWGNMAWIDHGDSATLFVSNAGFGIGKVGQPVQHTATVLRINLTIPAGQPPRIVDKTVIASGFGAQPDASVFLIGPTGLTLGKAGQLYVSDALANQVVAIPDAATRTDSAGIGTVLTQGGLLKRPLAMAMAPNGNLLVVNGLNGMVVEIDPNSGKQLGAQWIDADEAQTPPGSGDLFGLVASPTGKGVYYVEDDVNTLVHAQ